MEQAQYNSLFSFIWNIATDVLVYAFDKSEYKKIILPMMVLRRIDVLLEPTKKQVISMKENLDKNHIDNQDLEVYDEDIAERNRRSATEDELHRISERLQQGCA